MRAARDPESFAAVEPRISHLAREISRLLSIVEFEKDGRPVDVDGFRLRDLSQWADSRASNALDAIRPLSGRCNSRCVFCVEHGVPFAREASLLTEDEARVRLQHYVPETGASLFPSNRPEMETFLNPRALDILEMARRRDGKGLFCMTTNGSLLDEAVAERLSRLGPLLLKLSLNAADETLHRRLTGLGARTRTALVAPSLLRRHGIPFVGGMVAWPTMPLDAIERTVRYLEEREAYAVRIRLPLVHQWSREQPECAWNRHWSKVAAFVRTLECRVPILLEPTAFSVAPIIPQIDGVILHSPAERAGVRSGDLVLAINGDEVLTRTASEAVLRRNHESGARVDLRVSRDGRELLFHLDRADTATYPYDPSFPYAGQCYGIFHAEGFRLEYLARVFDLIREYGARHVLLFSSPLVAPIVDRLTAEIPEFAAARRDVAIHVESIRDTGFGGNFSLLDGRLVADFARAVRRRLAAGAEIDLILIPNAFGSAWGTDLAGESYAKLMLEFGIPVELIDWHFVYGRET